METNQTSENADDTWNESMNGSIILSELTGFVLLGFGLLGMFNGIEIGHPVYAVLFSNICFNFSTTFFNLILLIVMPFKAWVRATIFTNYLGMLYHNTWYVEDFFWFFLILILSPRSVVIASSVSRYLLPLF
jgi:hypothetical protein